MTGPMPFPRPGFSTPKEQLEMAHQFTDLIRSRVTEMTRKETEAVRTLLVIADADETKPGISVSVIFTGQTQDCYTFEQTVAFDESVPRGVVRYEPLPEGWLKS